MQKKYFLPMVIFVVGLTAYVVWTIAKSSRPQIVVQNPTMPPASSMSSSTSPPAISNKIDFKVYRNEQFGFEFQYPSDLIVRENTFGSPNSKFNLEVDALDKNSKHLDVFDINVVSPAFADHAFRGINSGTSTVIANVPGTRYEYEFEGLPEITILLPLGQNKIFLGLDGAAKFYGYENVFDQILATFKFLK